MIPMMTSITDRLRKCADFLRDHPGMVIKNLEDIDDMTGEMADYYGEASPEEAVSYCLCGCPYDQHRRGRDGACAGPCDRCELCVGFVPEDFEVEG